MIYIAYILAGMFFIGFTVGVFMMAKDSWDDGSKTFAVLWFMVSFPVVVVIGSLPLEAILSHHP